MYTEEDDRMMIKKKQQILEVASERRELLLLATVALWQWEFISLLSWMHHFSAFYSFFPLFCLPDWECLVILLEKFFFLSSLLLLLLLLFSFFSRSLLWTKAAVFSFPLCIYLERKKRKMGKFLVYLLLLSSASCVYYYLYTRYNLTWLVLTDWLTISTLASRSLLIALLT